MLVREPIGQLLRRNPLHVAELASQRPLQEKPIERPSTGKAPSAHCSSADEPDRKPAFALRTRRGLRYAIHLKKPRGPATLPAHFRTITRSNFMSQHRSLKGASTIAAKRNVLKRFERVELLKKRGQWKETSKVIGLPKTKPDV